MGWALPAPHIERQPLNKSIKRVRAGVVMGHTPSWGEKEARDLPFPEQIRRSLRSYGATVSYDGDGCAHAGR